MIPSMNIVYIQLGERERETKCNLERRLAGPLAKRMVLANTDG